MPRLVAGPPSQAAPSAYKLAPSEAFVPESVTATFDGTGAGGTFLPSLSIYSQDGKLIARSPATPVAAGSSAEVTFAPLLRAAIAAGAATSNLSYAEASATNVSIAVGTPGTFVFPDLANFDTNDAATFAHDTTGAVGHSGGIFVQAAGRYLAWAFARYVDPAGGAVEPAASQMYCSWDAYNYNGSQSDWAPNHSIATGFSNFPQAPWGAALNWAPFNVDFQDIGAAFVGPPYSEYHVALYNNGTQTMTVAATAMLVVRIGDSDGL